MLFNSYLFVLFFVGVWISYLLLRRKAQNALLLLTSYVFYGAWDVRFLALIWLSTAVDYLCGLQLERTDGRRRRVWLWLSLVTNLGILFFFKYFNFFAGSLIDLASGVGLELDWRLTQIVLPVGISFYTFQTLSYTIDVYLRRIKARTNLLDFALFVSFFPQLVAGPIERAEGLLPQIETDRKVDWNCLRLGGWLLLLGYFKKCVLADNMAHLVQPLIERPTELHGLSIGVSVVAFAFQIYGDFSGYSDIARGLAKMMGFDLMVNFRMPYFAKTPSDFWARWHISLSQWLRDYLYIPLGGSRHGQWRTARNLSLTMLLGGLWHGASWNFIVWGAYHGGLLILFRPWENQRGYQPTRWTSLRHWAQMSGFFCLTCFGWLLFALDDLSVLSTLLVNVWEPVWETKRLLELAFLVCLAFPVWCLEWVEETQTKSIYPVKGWPPFWRLATYTYLIQGIVFFGSMQKHEFIYFQF